MEVKAVPGKAAARGGSDPPDVSKFSPHRHLVRCHRCRSVASRRCELRARSATRWPTRPPVSRAGSYVLEPRCRPVRPDPFARVPFRALG